MKTLCEASSRNNDIFSKTGGAWVYLRVVVLILCVYVSQISGKFGSTLRVESITNGRDVEDRRWPWHATVYKVLNKSSAFICGGSILNKHTILTAAHCLCAVENFSFLSEDQVSVHVGRIRMSEANGNVQVLKVAKIVIHPGFRSYDVYNDIAIIKIASDINFNRSVKSVRLWSASDDQNQIFGKKGTVIGFGLNKKDELPETLQEATLTVVNVTTCLMNDRHVYGNYITHNMFCAGGKNNVSACNGDSGGGMFFYINGTWNLRGIVSFMPGRAHNTHLCDSTKYTVLTDVGKYRRWILRYTNTRRWMQKLKPCRNGVIVDEDIMCNAASRQDNDFLILAMRHEIDRFSFSDQQHILKHNLYFPSISYDCATDQIWVADNYQGTMYVIDNDGTDRKIFPYHTRSVSGLAMDWISRHLYWGDYRRQTIEVATLENPNVRTILFTNVEATSIAVDPHQGKLYWSSKTMEKENIEWSNLDGSERKVLIEDPQIIAIDDMKVSMVTGELCYSDSGTMKIECIDTRSKRIRTIVENITSAHTLISVANNKLYFIEWDSDQIKTIDNNGVLQKPINFTRREEVICLEAVTNICPVFHSQCATKNGGCLNNSICLLSPLDPSGKTCKSIVT